MEAAARRPTSRRTPRSSSWSTCSRRADAGASFATHLRLVKKIPLLGAKALICRAVGAAWGGRHHRGRDTGDWGMRGKAQTSATPICGGYAGEAAEVLWVADKV